MCCTAWGGVVALLLSGCASGPLVENPVRVRSQTVACSDNPLYLPQGPDSYGRVFEHVLHVVDAYFEIAYSNRYDGRIETFPRIAPGLGQPWKLGSPDLYQRTYATLQTLRHRAVVLIEPAHDGGYFVDVKVYKELEDLEKPTAPTAGAAIFRSDNTVERQFEVIDLTILDSMWIPIGRDEKMEQAILECIARFEDHAASPAMPSLDGIFSRPLPPPTPIPTGPPPAAVVPAPTPLVPAAPPAPRVG
jgi:hypothetical protein